MTSNISDLPKLQGLLLAGGFSSRMGSDKAALEYAGQDQLSRAFDLLAAVTDEAWVSIRAEQRDDPLRARFPILPDAWSNAGPMSAVATAFRRWPQRALLVLACDLPMLEPELLAALIEARGSQHDAVAYADPRHDGRPEPLCTIYEPSTAAAVEVAMREGRLSLRHLLAELDVHMLPAPWPEALLNVNTPEEHAQASRRLERGPDEKAAQRLEAGDDKD